MIESELCSLEEKNAALDKALSSRVFARSEQLKAFLRYICEAETVRHGSPLNEYVIGVEVLGRPEGYSPAEDSSVRTRAYELRQKLEKLYSIELPGEEVQISVPKGTYTPHYLRRASSRPGSLSDYTKAAEQEFPAPSTRPKTERRPFRFVLLAAVLVAAAAGSCGTWLAMRHAERAPEADTTLAEAWGPLAEGQSTVLLTVATPLSLIAGPFGHEVAGSRNYPAPPETYPLFRAHRLLAPDGQLGLTFSDNMIAAGTANAALICASTLRSFGSAYQFLPDKSISVSALRGRNAVLLGAPVDSETVAVGMQDLPLTVDFEPFLHEFVVRNRKTAQMIAPTRDAGGDLAEVYGLITVKESRDDRIRLQTVMLSGITSVGIQGAAEFFSSAASLRLLRLKMGKNSAARFPSTYQVVVKCRCNKLSLLSTEYFAHQISD